MNAEQRSFLRSRIHQEADKKHKTLEDKYVIPAKKLTALEIRNILVKNNKTLRSIKEIEKKTYRKEYDFKTRTYTTGYYSRDIHDYFDFSKFEHPSYIKHSAIYEKALDKLEIAKQKAIDAAMLGTNSEALAIIQKFTELQIV